MQRHIERLQAAMSPRSTHSPQRPRERTSGEPAQTPLGGNRRTPRFGEDRGHAAHGGPVVWFPGVYVVGPDALAAALPEGFVKPGTRRARHLPPDITVAAPPAHPDILGETLVAAHGGAIRVRSKAGGILPPPRLCRPARPGRQCRSHRPTCVEDRSHARGT